MSSTLLTEQFLSKAICFRHKSVRYNLIPISKMGFSKSHFLTKTWFSMKYYRVSIFFSLEHFHTPMAVIRVKKICIRVSRSEDITFSIFHNIHMYTFFFISLYFIEWVKCLTLCILDKKLTAAAPVQAPGRDQLILRIVLQ